MPRAPLLLRDTRDSTNPAVLSWRARLVGTAIALILVGGAQLSDARAQQGDGRSSFPAQGPSISIPATPGPSFEGGSRFRRERPTFEFNLPDIPKRPADANEGQQFNLQPVQHGTRVVPDTGPAFEIQPQARPEVAEGIARALQRKSPTGEQLIDTERLNDIFGRFCNGTDCVAGRPTSPLNPPAAEELGLRLQYETMTKLLSPEEIQSFFGQEAARALGGDASIAQWDAFPAARREALTALGRKIPTLYLDRLIDFKQQVSARLPHSSIEQTIPGTGVDGEPSLPISMRAPPPPGALPILPTPVIERPGNNAPAACGSLTFAQTPPPLQSADDFSRSQRNLIPYCQDGFSDVVLIDTANLMASAGRRICSGVRIDNNWVLTAKHCVKSWDAVSGRIFALGAGSARCLDQNDDSTRHPGDICHLPIVVRTGVPLVAPGRDLALIPVMPLTANSHFRADTVQSISVGQPIEVTLAGYGESPDGKLGRLRVGWSQILDQRALVALSTGQDSLNNNPIEYVPIVFTDDDRARGRLSSWSCSGDSGAPVFAGRVFGWLEEQHYVAGIVSGATITDRCRAEAPQPDQDYMEVVSLIEPVARAWLCDQTDRALAICQYP